jgi:hypothetical protein
MKRAIAAGCIFLLAGLAIAIFIIREAAIASLDAEQNLQSVLLLQQALIKYIDDYGKTPTRTEELVGVPLQPAPISMMKWPADIEEALSRTNLRLVYSLEELSADPTLFFEMVRPRGRCYPYKMYFFNALQSVLEKHRKKASTSVPPKGTASARPSASTPAMTKPAPTASKS